MKVLGIDPGLNGGLALIDTELSTNTIVQRMPTHARDGKKAIDWYLVHAMILMADVVVIEKIHSRPRQSAQSTFTFGGVYEGLIATCENNKIPYKLIPPREWKKFYKVTKDKKTSIKKAKKEFPNVNLVPKGCRTEHDGIAEALLIGKYVLDKNVR